MTDAFHRHLARALNWHQARVDFDAATADVPPAQQGTVPAGLPHSLWQLVAHMRFTQRDLLDYCRPAPYTSHTWPDAYWPDTPAPPDAEAWARTLDAFRNDRDAMQLLFADADTDLLAPVPHAQDASHTYLRCGLILLDHNAYHTGQIVLVRHALGLW